MSAWENTDIGTEKDTTGWTSKYSRTCQHCGAVNKTTTSTNPFTCYACGRTSK